MKRFSFCILAAAIFFTELPALEWPSDTQDFLRLFGQRIGKNTFEQGLVFKEVTTVRAADNGILLIALDKKYGTGAFPSTLGNALVLLHDDGLQTVYGNLDDTTVFRTGAAIESTSVIGRTGNSGWGKPHDLIFQVSDNQKKVYINPLLLLPSVNDKIAPQIQNIILINEQNTVFQVSGQKNIRHGSYGLYADISDTMVLGGHSFSPFRITVFVNGTNIRTIPFETIMQKDGGSYLGNTAFTDALLYRRNDGLYLGKIILNRGKSDILITTRDITGNEKSERFTIQVD